VPDDTDAETVDTARATAMAKQARENNADTHAETLSSTYLSHLDEDDCLQILHIGPCTDEAATLANLHDHVMPDLGLTFGGAHHEIYLSDPRRRAPDRLKTILRQPVRPV